MIPVIIRSDGNKLSSVRSFIILQSEEVLTSFNKIKPTNFCGEKSEIELSGMSVLFLE